MQNGGWKKDGPALLATCKYFDENGNGLGTHSWTSTMWYYDRKDIPNYETFPSMGYQLNVQLREGEKITRNWAMNPAYIGGGDPFICKGDRTALRLQTSLGDQAPGRIGSGTVEYNVPLASGAFRAGTLASDNLACTAEDKAAPALHVQDAAKDGVLVVRMNSSYIYVGGTLEFAAVVGEGGSIVASFSDNNGLDWKPVATVAASGAQKVDLGYTKENGHRAFRRYDYRVKFELKGKGTGLDSLKISNPFQCSQAALPTITEGKNTITFNAGPQEGTVTVEGATSTGAARYKNLTAADFHPVLNKVKKELLRVEGEGDATWTIASPGDVTRVRMNLGYRCRDANKDFFDVNVSFDGGKTFKKVEHLGGPTAGYTKYMTVSDVPAGVREVQVKLTGKEMSATCLFGLRFDVDYKEPNGGFRPVKVTYVWDEAGQEKTDVHVVKQPQETYTITCGVKTTVKSFAVELDK